MAEEIRTTSLNFPTYRPAGFWRRFVAFLIDWQMAAFLVIPITLTVMIFTQLALIKSGANPIVVLVFQQVFQFGSMGIAYLLYCSFWYKRRGTTLGKLVMGIRVMNMRTGTWLSTSEVIKRELVGKIASFLTLMIGYLMAGVRSDKRGLHDFVAETIVIREVK